MVRGGRRRRRARRRRRRRRRPSDGVLAVGVASSGVSAARRAAPLNVLVDRDSLWLMDCSESERASRSPRGAAAHPAARRCYPISLSLGEVRPRAAARRAAAQGRRLARRARRTRHADRRPLPQLRRNCRRAAGQGGRPDPGRHLAHAHTLTLTPTHALTLPSPPLTSTLTSTLTHLSPSPPPSPPPLTLTHTLTLPPPSPSPHPSPPPPPHPYQVGGPPERRHHTRGKALRHASRRDELRSCLGVSSRSIARAAANEACDIVDALFGGGRRGAAATTAATRRPSYGRWPRWRPASVQRLAGSCEADATAQCTARRARVRHRRAVLAERAAARGGHRRRADPMPRRRPARQPVAAAPAPPRARMRAAALRPPSASRGTSRSAALRCSPPRCRGRRGPRDRQGRACAAACSSRLASCCSSYRRRGAAQRRRGLPPQRRPAADGRRRPEPRREAARAPPHTQAGGRTRARRRRGRGGGGEGGGGGGDAQMLVSFDACNQLALPWRASAAEASSANASSVARVAEASSAM